MASDSLAIRLSRRTWRRLQYSVCSKTSSNVLVIWPSVANVVMGCLGEGSIKTPDWAACGDLVLGAIPLSFGFPGMFAFSWGAILVWWNGSR